MQLQSSFGIDVTGDGLYLPTTKHNAYKSNINSNQPGVFISNANNYIDNFFVNMEHSYMGDLTITFICPNGQSDGTPARWWWHI